MLSIMQLLIFIQNIRTALDYLDLGLEKQTEYVLFSLTIIDAQLALVRQIFFVSSHFVRTVQSHEL